MQQQQPLAQSPQNNMITSIENIPLKTTGITLTDDMSDDPIVKDVLTEFEKELNINTQQIPRNNNYKINNNQYPPNDNGYDNANGGNMNNANMNNANMNANMNGNSGNMNGNMNGGNMNGMNMNGNRNKNINYIDNILITKTFIICIIVAIIINPVIYNTIISNIPQNFIDMIENYNYFIKIIIIFIAIYIMMFYKLL